MRDPLLAPLAAIATGVLVSRFVSFEIRELLTVIAAFLFLGIVSTLRASRMLAGACVLAGLFFSGALAYRTHLPGPRPELNTEGRAPVILSGCVVEPPVLSGERERFVLELEPGARVQVTLYAKPDDPFPDLRYGQRIEFTARVRRTRSFENPGAFDYAHYLARKQIYWTASAPAAAGVQVLDGECGSRFQKAIADLRTAALARIDGLLPGDAYNTAMLRAILLGEASRLESEWTKPYLTTGTYHVLVISGTHVAVLSAFLLFLLRLFFVPSGAAATIAVLCSWIYALVTGWQAPAIRAAAALTLYLIARYFFREQRVVNLLAGVAIAFLMLDPEQMFEASFQLSFLSVAFLALFAIPWLERSSAPLARALPDLSNTDRDLRLAPRVAQFRVEMRLLAETVRVWTRLPERISSLLITLPVGLFFHIYGLVLTSAVIQMGLTLPMVIYFHRSGLIGLLANAAVVPITTPIVPIGFLALITGSRWLAKLAALLLHWSQAVVEFSARLAPDWRVPTPPLWLAVAVAGFLIAAALVDRLRRRWSIPVWAGVAVLLGVLLWHPFPPKIAKNELELAAIDVGQGDSLLLGLPDGKVMIMDAGGIPTFGSGRPSRLDIGEDVVAPYLWTRSIRRIDVLALSHAHADHIGGVSALLEDFQVGELWTGALPDSETCRALLESARRKGVRVTQWRRGQHFDYGGARIEVLAPAADYVPSAVARNNDSLVLRLSLGKHSFLLSGDVERAGEDELWSQHLVGKTDVLKVAHHGSRTSSSAELLDALDPAIALISTGSDNSYGHPNREVLERLEERRVEVFRTDRNGMISVRSNGQRLSVEPVHWNHVSRD